MNLHVNLAPNRDGGLVLRNPVMTAAGPYGYGREAMRAVDLSPLGAFVTRTTTLYPQAGGSLPRLAQAPAGVLHNIGWPNPGLGSVLKEYAPRWQTWSLPVILSVAGQSAAECATIGRQVEDAPGLAGVELNLSLAPREDGLPAGYDAAQSWALVRALRETCSLPMLAKLPLRLPGLAEVVQAVMLAGADAVTLVAALPGLTVDVKRKRVSMFGGLSGPAVRPVVLRAVYEVAREVPGVPLVAAGGVSCGEDAAGYLLAGATAVQVGWATLADPRAAIAVLSELEKYLGENGIQEISELTGAAL